MADAQKTIDLVFNGVDKTGAAVQSVLSNTKGLAGSIESATQPFANASAQALKYEAALLATGAAITAFSIKAAGDFDSGFREIATLIDEPISALQEFRGEILAYGESSSASLSEVNQAVYSAISAGVDYTRSLDTVRVAEQLAIAGKGELGDTLTLLVSSLNAYGLETEEATRFSDALFSTVRLGQTTLPELNASLQGVTTTAATLGVPFEEVLAALAALTSTGTPTAQAVTQINAVLTALLKPTAQAAGLAEELGLEFNAQALRADGLQGTLEKVAEATGRSEEQMALLFGRQEAIKGSFSLTGIAAGKFAENLTEVESSAGATEAAYSKMAGSLEQITGRLGSSFEVLSVSIGTPLLDDFGNVADAIGAVFSALGASFDGGELSQITRFIEEEFGRLTDLFNGIATALPAALEQADISGITDGLTEIRDAVVGLFGDLDLTDAEDLGRAIEFIANAFEGLSSFSAGIIDSFEGFAQLLTRLAEQATEGGDGLRQLGEVFGTLTVANIASGAVGNLVGALEGLALVIIGAKVSGLSGGLAAGLRGVTGAISGAGGLVAGLGSLAALGAAGGVGFGIGTLANEISELTTGETLSAKLVDWIAGFTRLDDIARDALEPTRISAETAAEQIAAADESMSNLSGSIEETVDFWGEYGSETGKVVATLEPLPPLIDDAAKSTQALADAAEKTRIEAEKITLEEKVALIDANATVAAASVSANADVMVAAFETIGNTVDTARTNLSELFGLLGDENISKFDKLGLKEQIRAEQEQLEKTQKLQDRLTQEKIRELRARNEAFRNGGGLINIDGAGLQPHLEAFMFEILEAIQVRVNAEGQSLLLGI